MKKFFLGVVCICVAACGTHESQQKEVSCQRIICTSATQIGFLAELDALDCVVGAFNKSLIYTPLHDSVADLGDDMQPQMEKVLALHPDMVLLTAYMGGNPLEEQLKKLGIPYRYINEWQEPSILLRAGWIRTVGALVGKTAYADTLYNRISSRYNALLDTIASQRNEDVYVLSGQDFRGTWYVPSGNTYMGKLFRDAGLKYIYANDSSLSSLPLSFEKVLLDCQNADVWVGCNAKNLTELQQINPQHTLFKAFQEKRVYNYYKRTTPLGGNDFWESGVVHPERILQDLYNVKINRNDNFFYINKLE